MRSADEIFRDALPSISFAPVNETPKPSGKVLGREFYHDSAGRTILGNTVTDQMGGGANAPADCECNVATLAATYYVTSDAAPGVVATIESSGVLPGDTCYDVQWGGQDPEGILLVGMDFLGPEPTRWQIGFDTPSVTLYKVAGSGPGGDCDISTPEGTYEGGGYTATVSLTP